MVKNFVPTCDLCGREIAFGQNTKRKVAADGIELFMVALGNSDPDLEFVQNADGTIDLDTCPDCYARMAFHYSEVVN